MNRIRIGSDIRLNFNVCPDDSGFSIGTDINQANIKQIKCYLVNTEKYYINDENNKDAFIRIKYPQFYHPTAYNINNSGFPSYHLLPHNVDNYDHFLPDFHDYHWWPGFRGFGMHPERFGPKHNCVPKNWYFAESQVLPADNMATCIFPATEQRIMGKYKLVIVVTIYKQGWNKNNLCTYTIDKGDVFELVADESGQSGVVIIDVDELQDNMIKEITPKEDSYTLYNGDIMYLGNIDATNKQYGINVKLIDDSEFVYNPYTWRYNKLNFISSNPDLVTIDEQGKIKVSKDITEDQEVTIFVSSSADSSVYGRFTLNIIYFNVEGMLRIGFSEKTDTQDFKKPDNTYDFSSLQEYQKSVNKYNITNEENGKYLWIVSDFKIDTVTSYSIEVPMLHSIVGGYHIYRTEMAVLAGDMQIKIEYER